MRYGAIMDFTNETPSLMSLIASFVFNDLIAVVLSICRTCQ